MSNEFETLVIGKGLVGSAAARHLSKHSKKIVVIGPHEPSPGQEPLVQAAHYDQARVQRRIGWEKVWTDLNMASVRSYADLERSTGITFHHTPGCLYVDPYGGDDYLAQAVPQLDPAFVAGRSYTDPQELASDFPYFDFPEQSVAMFESAPAGYINPRLLVEAQCSAACDQGCTFIDATVTGLETKSGRFVAHMHDGRTVAAEKVLVATGSFANHLGLLKKPVALRSKGETVLLAKVGERLAHEWSSMPSLLYEWDEEDIEGVYLLPPVTYPDGGVYVKIGANFPEDPVFTDLDQVRAWFRSGNSDQFASRLKAMLKAILPDVPVHATLTKRCIVSYTPNRRPYIGRTNEEGLFLAGGCNGYSAMCSDAMGWVAASLVGEGRYPEGYSEDALGVVY